MDPSAQNIATKMSFLPAVFDIDRSKPNLVSSNIYHSPLLNSMGTSSNHHHSYPDNLSTSSSSSSSSSSSTLSSLNYTDLLRAWNYHRLLTSALTTDQLSDNSSSDYYSRNDCKQQYSSRTSQKSSLKKPTHDEILLKKFHRDTLVNLDAGESKNIQELTNHDLLKSAKKSNQYSSLLARIDYIGTVDLSTGRVELRFYIDDVGKTATCYVLQAVPFFVHQHSCWASLSPEQTHRLCGLKCRQLECGDIIIAITEQQQCLSSPKIEDKPNYSQQSPTKCLVGRYMNGRTSSANKRYKASNE